LSAKALLARAMPGVYQSLKRNGANGSQATTTWPEMMGWWNRDWLQEFADEQPSELPQSKRDRLTKKLYQDAMRGELQELLRYGDRNSMAFSREVRQPFLDHRIAEFVFTLPPDQKLFRGETKVVMREAIRGLVPESIVKRQDKLGYQAPMAGWFNGALSVWAESRLEGACAQLSARAIGDWPGRFRKFAGHLDESSAWAVFSILTFAEASTQMKQLCVESLR
ncbi:MAG TPA: asparagine synthase C-terminal domain-containing protein, partial [Blastocatellia bacterium]